MLNGTQQFKYTYTDPNNCTFSKDFSVNIGEADVHINRNDTIICMQERLAINANSEFVKGTKWIKSPLSDGSYIGSITSKNIEYLTGTNDQINKGYWIHIKTTDPVCKEVFDSVFININEVKADFSVDTTIGFLPFLVNFNDQSYSHVASISNWYWTFGDGQTSFNQNPQHNYLDTGYFNVSLSILSAEGCYDSLYKSSFIHVKKNIGIVENEDPEIQIYPNPANKYLVIKLDHKSFKIQSISLINPIGQLLHFYPNISNTEFVIEPIQQLEGVYFLKIVLSNGESVYSTVIFE